MKILFTNCWTTLLKGGPLGHQKRKKYINNLRISNY
uniref:Uncharacterized protein n=1 Tax=Siphoviridae sp. ct3r22 TaxID=2825325 RepID=A0A8S5V0Z0_9CAUD|nr:MAG TPA: hypothetical protein [Siphoviridae sp. ct3r22]